jgi:mono/diheme cytochrome c family protein
MSAARSSGQVCNLAAGFVFALCALCGCAADTNKPEMTKPEYREPEIFATGKEQLERLCGRGRTDSVIDAFCLNKKSVGSLLDLRAAVGLDSNENLVDHGFALTAHSTSLSLRVVSAINPRIIFVRPQIRRETASVEFVSLAFARGEQFAELAGRDRNTDALQFYLVTFTQDCNDKPGGCSPGDLLTEAVESNWHDVNVYAEEDLENTPVDCRTCHQPDGPGTDKILRMQELDPPWNHWFWRQADSGKAVLADYMAAKGDEMFAGLKYQDIYLSQPGLLSFALTAVGSGTQPNAFVSSTIEKEVDESAAQMGGNQPVDNSVPGKSKTWDEIYETAKRGDAIPVPYHDVKVTDPKKLADMTQAYTDYRAGKLDRQDLPDLREVFLDDPARRAEMGFDTEPGMDGEAVLLQACGQCHNDRLDQTVSRARFQVDLSKVSREEKDKAIARLRIPTGELHAMPPPQFRRLSDEARNRLIALLKK